MKSFLLILYSYQEKNVLLSEFLVSQKVPLYTTNILLMITRILPKSNDFIFFRFIIIIIIIIIIISIYLCIRRTSYFILFYSNWLSHLLQHFSTHCFFHFFNTLLEWLFLYSFMHYYYYYYFFQIVFVQIVSNTLLFSVCFFWYILISISSIILFFFLQVMSCINDEPIFGALLYFIHNCFSFIRTFSLFLPWYLCW